MTTKRHVDLASLVGPPEHSHWQLEQIEGTNISIERLGDPNSSSKIILLHGGPGMDPSYFKGYVERLSIFGELITYSHGQLKINSIDSLVDELNLILSFFGDRLLHLVGHSFGGTLALETLSRNPVKNLKSLVLVSHVHAVGWADRSRKRNTDQYLVWERTATPIECGQQDEAYRLQMLAGVNLYFSGANRDEGIRLFTNSRFDENLRSAISRDYLHSLDLTPKLRDICIPMLVIAGSDDAIVDIEHTSAVADLVCSADFCAIPGARHFPMVENPEMFIEIVSGFFAGHRTNQQQ